MCIENFSAKERKLKKPSCEKCSWKFHGRCLKEKETEKGEKEVCEFFTTRPHVCLTCWAFAEEHGKTVTGDQWFGFCKAYGEVTIIRTHPAMHACKAWRGCS